MTQGSFTKTVLPSGLTVLSDVMPERHSVSVGVWLRGGAREEPAARLGITHFLEHMLFKGTERRSARAIAASLESLGGHLDAFTAREQVCYYGRALAEHLDEVVDVLADIVCHPLLAADEVEREKGVVQEEILSCEDNPEDKVNDLLVEHLWGDHALGRPILGTQDTVGALTAPALREHFRSCYRPERLVVSAAGGLEHARLLDLVAARFDPPSGPAGAADVAPPPRAPGVVHAERDLQQLHLSLGARGVHDLHPERHAIVILHTLLGAGMSSRLFQSVRERAGLAYSIYSALDFFRDCGMLSIHLGVSPERGREALALVRRELAAVVTEGVPADEVVAAQSQIRGGVLLEHESVSARMVHAAHEELYRGTYTPPEELVRRVLAVTPDEVAAAARRYADPAGFTVVALGPAPAEGPFTARDWA